MNLHKTPILDPRDAARLFEELVTRRPAYLPDWIPADSGAGQALLRIFARHTQAVIDRLNQAPDKNLLAFLDMLGISLIPAQAARAPVVFKPMPNANDGRIAARTRVGAEVAGRDDPLIFETENAMAMAAAQLVEVRTLWPARDEYADHASAVAGGRAFTLFESRRPVPHEFYLAHETLFVFAGKATVQIEFELSTPGSDSLKIGWEYWDGQVWRPFREFDSTDKNASQDGTTGLTRSGVVTLRAECGPSKKTTVNGIEAHWVRGRLDQSLPPDPTRVLPVIDRLRVRTVIDRREADLLPQAAFADGLEVDLENTIYPFGQQPQPGSTFYLASEEIFSKPQARVTLRIKDAASLQEQAEESDLDVTPELSWEYWDGQRWRAVDVIKDATNNLRKDGAIEFIVPEAISRREVNGQDGLWMRIHLEKGGYGRKRTIEWSSETDGSNSLSYIETVPPALSALNMGYIYHSSWERPQHCLTHNDFQFELHSDDVRWPGGFFPPFRPVADVTPVLYLGFDRPLPNDLVTLYLDIQEREAPTPSLVWEAWDGTAWSELSVADQTAGLGRPGMVSFVAPAIAYRPQAKVNQAGGSQVLTGSPQEAALFQPGDRLVIRQDKNSEMAVVDQVQNARLRLETPLTHAYSGGTASLAALPRFGVPRDWVRVRLKEPGAPAESRVNGIHPNAAWALQVQTLENEVLGSAIGRPNQAFFFTQLPVLPGEQIEVRELEGARAEVELPILKEDLRQKGLGENDLHTVTDPRTGKVTEVWVRWQSRPHLFFSGPDDRHYVIERARGRLICGDDRNGRIFPAGANNIRARRYRAGGGLIGNVPAGAITQLLGAAPFVQAVTNPRTGEGGAEGEILEEVKVRGPQVIRHRRRSLAARDYEALAREASPGVAVARALPTTAPNGRPAPGWVTVIIVPQSRDPQPQPSFGLRRRVHDYLAVRAPATVAAGHIAVIGPTYLPIGVAAGVIARDASQAGAVGDKVEAALRSFLHPLTGGPEGRGWPFGRDVYSSDVAALLEGIEGVDYVEEFNLLLNDTPQGERVAVPPDRIVVAGTLRIEMKAPQRWR